MASRDTHVSSVDCMFKKLLLRVKLSDLSGAVYEFISIHAAFDFVVRNQTVEHGKVLVAASHISSKNTSSETLAEVSELLTA